MSLFTNSDLAIRDCFVVPYAPERRYYLFSTSVAEAWEIPPHGLDVYTGTDLTHWDGPTTVFRPPPDFWADRHFWGPEVHQYQGRYYMFVSFKSETAPHGTQILVSDHPGGPFEPHSDGVVTPRNWECLDGMLFRTFEGQHQLALHHSNRRPHERPLFLPVREENGKLMLA